MIARKNKIDLSEYNFKRDIENRIFLTNLTKQEIEILKEIVNNSVQFSIKSLADILNLSASVVTQALQKISQSKLLILEGDMVTVDKELRKYFEFHLRKFDSDFLPSVDFISSILCRIPHQVLHNWYQISRTSDSIFSSIIEKYLINPRVYEKYLADLQFENPIIDSIIKDINQAPDCRLETSVLREKYKLTHAQFIEYVLHLEFNFIAFISYEETDEKWVEVVTPFYEWRDYLRYYKSTQPKPIVNVHEIQIIGYQDFQFLSDLNAILKASMKDKILVDIKDGVKTIDTQKILHILPHLEMCAKKYPEYHITDYLSRILKKIQLLDLGVVDKTITPTKEAGSWLSKTLPEQAMILYRNSMNRLHSTKFDLNLVNEKNLREAEKSLKRVVNSGWVYFDEFIHSVFVPVGQAEQITLKCKGKKWKYMIPVYTEQEKALIEAVIFERLFDIGMTSTGTHNGRRCFCVTAIGRSALGE
jgi:predicted transcriptional regulator